MQLTTTDPAQHIAETLQVAVPNLTVDFIDPKAEVRRYRERTLQSAKAKRTPEEFALLREELQSPCYEDYTKVLIVALPETTPVLEAASLQEDLRRAAIQPFAWASNASLAAARHTDPILRARAAAEMVQFENVRTRYAEQLGDGPEISARQAPLSAGYG